MSNWLMTTRSEDPLRDLCLLLWDMLVADDLKTRRNAADRRWGRGRYAKVPPTQEG